MSEASEEKQRRAIRRQVLAEWRGMREPRDTSSYTRGVGELVPALLKRLGISERLNEERLSSMWSGMVGEFVANYSRPVKLERKTLVAAVAQPSVMYTLERELKRPLLIKVQEELGAGVVARLRFVAG